MEYLGKVSDKGSISSFRYCKSLSLRHWDLFFCDRFVLQKTGAILYDILRKHIDETHKELMQQDGCLNHQACIESPG